jgi:serine beta-lactamase-like protein LACTB, mitochondrial
MRGSIRVLAPALLLASHNAVAQTPNDSVRVHFQARMQALGIPGAQLVVMRDGREAVSVSYGYSDAEGKVPITDTTRFRVGSISKLFTATAALKLASAGHLDLDAPVSTLVPEFVPTRGPVTPRLLAGHLGGVRHYVNADFTRPPQRYATVIDALTIFARDTLFFEPGTRYFYTSYGYNLLGAAVERAAKEDFRKHVERTIVRPLRMTRTMYERADSAFGGVAGTFDGDGDGRWKPTTRTDLSDRWPSGGVLSTARDIALLAEATVRGSLFTPQERAVLFTSMTTKEGKETGVGFGWRIGKDSAGRVVYHHGGASAGGRAMLVTWKDQGLTVAITTNLSPEGRRAVSEADAMAIGAILLR